MHTDILEKVQSDRKAESLPTEFSGQKSKTLNLKLSFGIALQMKEILSALSIISLQNKAESTLVLFSEKLGGKIQVHQPRPNKAGITHGNHKNLTKEKCKVWKIKWVTCGMLRRVLRIFLISRNEVGVNKGCRDRACCETHNSKMINDV